MVIRGKKLLVWSLAICFVLIQTLLSSIASADTLQSKRLFGSDRYKTAVTISQKGWNASDYVVLARGDDFADALCAGPLAKKYNAPILLTETDVLNTDTLVELKRLKVKKIFIVGGTGAVSQSVEEVLKSLGIAGVERIYGTDRYETSVKIAEKLGAADTVVLATGVDFPDALSISVIASKLGMPILLTEKDSLSDKVKQYIASKQISKSYMIGGTGVISDDVKDMLPRPVRLWGKDRFETNVAVMHEFESQLNFKKLYIAVGQGPTGDEFADALTGAALAAKTSSPVILNYITLSDVTAEFIKSKVMLATDIVSLGGEKVVPAEAANKIIGFISEIEISANYNNAGTYGPAAGTDTISGNVEISASEVTLQNTIVEGDIIFAESLGSGNATLNNVTVKGTIKVRGGGSNSIHLIDTKGNELIIDADARVTAEGNTIINSSHVNSSGILEEINLTDQGFTDIIVDGNNSCTLIGNFNNVTNNGGIVNHTKAIINNYVDNSVGRAIEPAAGEPVVSEAFRINSIKINNSAVTNRITYSDNKWTIDLKGLDDSDVINSINYTALRAATLRIQGDENKDISLLSGTYDLSDLFLIGAADNGSKGVTVAALKDNNSLGVIVKSISIIDNTGANDTLNFVLETLFSIKDYIGDPIQDVVTKITLKVKSAAGAAVTSLPVKISGNTFVMNISSLSGRDSTNTIEKVSISASKSATLRTSDETISIEKGTNEYDFLGLFGIQDHGTPGASLASLRELIGFEASAYLEYPGRQFNVTFELK